MERIPERDCYCSSTRAAGTLRNVLKTGIYGPIYDNQPTELGGKKKSQVYGLSVG